MFLFKAYNITVNNISYYRLIFYSNEGFVENIFKMDEGEDIA
jgi:hypothetical protein